MGKRRADERMRGSDGEPTILTSSVVAGVAKVRERGRRERRADWVEPAPSRDSDNGVARGIIPEKGEPRGQR